MAAECYYHPAPLTRPTKRVRVSSSDFHGSESIVASGWSSPVVPPSLNNHTRVNALVDNNNGSSRTLSVRGSNSTPSGALPSLFSLQGLDDTNPRPIIHAATYDDRGNKTLEGDLLSITQILSHVQHCAIIKKLVTEYYDLGQAAVIPRHLVLPAIADFEQIHEEVLSHGAATTDENARRAALLPVAERIRLATISKIEITPSTSLDDFRSYYTGANLRVETIGLICTLAARAARVGLFPDDMDVHDFVQTMFQCSARCVHLTRELATEMNDIIVWLSYENLRITTSIQGYAGMSHADARKPGMIYQNVYDMTLLVGSLMWTQFYIHRLLAKGDASCSPHLVQTCSSLIEMSLEIGGFRTQTVYDVYRNFRASTVLCYGLPSAITLVNALKTAKGTLSRANFADLLRLVSIRRLYVFVSLLESVYRPEDANYAICMKASSLIARAMDGVLEHVLSGFANDEEQLGAGLTNGSTISLQDSTSTNYATGAWQVDTALDGITDWDAAALMDMNDWMEGIDWTNVSGRV
ncbi:hypothetical protein QM012_007624 [Aureobasidium pullulans]|uniref:Transcription factor domain-containing protein n=1 Tax=Aureobasidium pullulans TaxID=5580 RepID=A0ABR0TK61_AURPU